MVGLMKRALPWIVAAVALIGFGASFSELQRVRARFGEVTSHKFHDHAEVREFIIRAALAETRQPIVVIGDSVAEMAPLPRQICGRSVINAGVGGMTIREAKRLAARAIGERGAFMVALAIGANDAGSQTARQDFAELIEAVKPLSARPLVAISTAPDAQTSQQIGEAASGVLFVDPLLPPGSKMPDGIHFTAAAYSAWVPALEAAIAKLCG
ncbi:SGNH/GDSL hydrolase family protein [Bradyrhizobium hereditatis]|uniref:SGNH/GDSL hydrolase family protein n=1 Tax=Bradyrhizobium hereditatis TaxID=2821405 RepID=UPI001CE2D9F0|nr:SGNH/GDSL hydrolase family protein [Bradyrhizobium hereditatis]